MRVIQIPSTLLTAAIFLLLSLPLAALETIIAARASLLSPQWKPLGFWTLVAFCIYLPLAVWNSNGRRWAHQTTALLHFVWCVTSAWMAIRMKNPNLGFFTLGLVVFCLLSWLWLDRELSQSYLDAHLRWYQGRPQPIPGLHCQVLPDGESYRVARFGPKGAVVFSDRDLPPEQFLGGRTGGPVRLSFRFGENQIQ